MSEVLEVNTIPGRPWPTHRMQTNQEKSNFCCCLGLKEDGGGGGGRGGGGVGYRGVEGGMVGQ